MRKRFRLTPSVWAPNENLVSRLQAEWAGLPQLHPLGSRAGHLGQSQLSQRPAPDEVPVAEPAAASEVRAAAPPGLGSWSGSWISQQGCGRRRPAQLKISQSRFHLERAANRLPARPQWHHCPSVWLPAVTTCTRCTARTPCACCEAPNSAGRTRTLAGTTVWTGKMGGVHRWAPAGLAAVAVMLAWWL